MRKLYCRAATGRIGGFPGAAAFLCTKINISFADAALSSLFSAKDSINPRIDFQKKLWRAATTRDALLLDQTLASLLADLCPAAVLEGAAVTIKAWEDGPTGGGVLGRIDENQLEANQQVTAVGEDLWSVAYPGGPGLLLQGNRKLAMLAAEIIARGREEGHNPWPFLQHWLTDKNVPAYLYTTDGSGSQGFLATAGAELSNFSFTLI